MDYHSASSIFPSFSFLTINPASTTVLIIIILILFFLSFILAGSEVAFFSLSSKDINILKTKKKPAYRRIVLLLEEPKMLLAGMLIANSFVNIGIILISNILMDGLFIGFSFWVIFILKVGLVSFLLLLFAEVLPKVWATHHKVWFASSTSLSIEIINSMFFRLSKRFVKFSDGIERRMAPEKVSGMDQSNLDYAIDLLPENEATVEEKQILKGIRKFSGTTVKQIMRTRLDVCGIAYNYSFDKVLIKTAELNYSRLPVYKTDLDEIAGMLHTKDLLPHINKASDFDWHSIMRNPYFVHEQKLIEDLLQEFRAKRIHFAVVVDEFGGTSGIVTLEDIVEEVIGDIRDEFDDEEIVNKKIDDNTYIFEGRTMLNDVCKTLGLSPDAFEKIRGESDSLAGLVLEIAGEFPQINETFNSGDFTFIPLEINKNRIDKVKVVIQSKEILEQQ